MSEKYYDFDAWQKEKQGDPITIKVYGQVHELPSDIPFDAVLSLSRQMKDGAEEMDEQQMVDMAHIIFGKETFDGWIKQGMGIRGVSNLIESVMLMYQDDTQQAAKKNNKKRK